MEEEKADALEEEEEAEVFKEEEEEDGALEEDVVAGLGGNNDVNFFLSEQYAAAPECFAPSTALPPPDESELVSNGNSLLSSDGLDCCEPTFGPLHHAQVATFRLQYHLQDAAAAASPCDGLDLWRRIEREPVGLWGRGCGDAELLP